MTTPDKLSRELLVHLRDGDPVASFREVQLMSAEILELREEVERLLLEVRDAREDAATYCDEMHQLREKLAAVKVLNRDHVAEEPLKPGTDEALADLRHRVRVLEGMARRGRL